MDGRQFDRIAKALASLGSRRRFIAQGTRAGTTLGFAGAGTLSTSMAGAAGAQQNAFPPMIPSLKELLEGADPEQGVALMTPIWFTPEELQRGLGGAQQVNELPPGIAGVSFYPNQDGYLGIPFCQSPSDDVTCYPSPGGPDDNPFGYVCVCVGPLDQDRPPIIVDEDAMSIPEPTELPQDFGCVLVATRWGEPFACRKRTERFLPCDGTCTLVWTQPCGPGRLVTPVAGCVCM